MAVRNLFGSVPVPARMASALRSIADRLERGEVSAVAAVAITLDGEVEIGHAGRSAAGPLTLLGAIQCLSFDITEEQTKGDFSPWDPSHSDG